MKSSTETLIAALRVLANDIQSQDGIANAAIAEAADRMEELYNNNDLLRIKLEKCQGDLATYNDIWPGK